MSKLKHTSGPLEVQNSDELYIFIRKSGGKGYPVAKCMRKNSFIDGCPEANANLFAAAPEMIDALKESLEILKILKFKKTDDPRWNILYSTQRKVEKAITKAIGGDE